MRALALACGRPDDGLDVVAIARSDRQNRNSAVSTFPAMDGDVARRHLHELVALYDRGMCEPLPIACATSAAYAEAVRNERDAVGAAAKAWTSTDRFRADDADDEHVLVYGGRIDFDDLFASPPCAGEEGEGWSETEASRFGRYALRFWNGLLEHEQLEHRR